MKNYTKIYKKSQILIEKCHVPLFYEILAKFFNISFHELIAFFKKKAEEEEFIKIKDSIEYLKPSCFISDSFIKNEENIRKKTSYLKYKTIPKWHYHALDLLRYNISVISLFISQISNSRKSFIFSKFGYDEDNTDILGKKKLDIDTIRLKLKLKIYNDIHEVVDDVMKMIKNASVTLNKSKIALNNF